MPTHSILFYVADPLKSATFYEKLLGAKPLEASPGFAMFALSPPMTLGLWKRDHVEPKVEAASGSAELLFQLDSPKDVDAFFANSRAQDIKILQNPTQMDFGYTFTAADPDGNRLRVFAPAS